MLLPLLVSVLLFRNAIAFLPFFNEDDLKYTFGVESHVKVPKHEEIDPIPYYHQNGSLYALEFMAFDKNYNLTLVPTLAKLLSTGVTVVRKNEKKGGSLDFGSTIDSCHYHHYGKKVYAAISNCDGRIKGTVIDDGEIIVIHPFPDHHAHRSKRNTENGAHVVYKRETLAGPEPNDFCGLDNVVTEESLVEDESAIFEDVFVTGQRLTQESDLIVELAVFVDENLWRHFSSKYGGMADRKLQDYTLTLLNNIQIMYYQPTASPPLTFRVIRYEVLTRQPAALAGYLHNHGNAQMYLDRFCRYQRNLAVRDWDHAIMLTGYDIHRGAGSRSISGIARLDGMCDPWNTCTLAEGLDFTSAFIGTHELGHSVGMRHDEPYCPSKHIMSSSLGPGKVTWSTCSLRDYHQFLQRLDGRGKNCLRVSNMPTKLEISSNVKPGQIYDANLQCELMHGNGYQQVTPRQDSYDGICYMMWCGQSSFGRIITSHPALEGTFCGPSKWCQLGRCVPWTATNEINPPVQTVAPVVTTLPSRIDGSWSGWGATICSQCTCNGILGSVGLSISRRTCSAPYPANGGSDCIGSTSRAVLCSRQCGRATKSVDEYISEKCMEQKRIKNDRELTGKGSQLNRFPQRACKVFCDVQQHYGSQRNYRFFGDNLPDGTSCGYDRYCLDGECLALSCNNNALVSRDLSCPTDTCPITDQSSSVFQGQWSTWSLWTSCTVTCGGGYRKRNRACSITGQCDGSEDETEICGSEPCPSVLRTGNEWSSWTEWNHCSVSCGRGSQARYRKCLSPHRTLAFDCPEKNIEVRSCDNGPCNAIGVWGTWGTWSTCSTSCGPGTLVRQRTCNREPCDGSAHESGEPEPTPIPRKGAVPLIDEESQSTPRTENGGSGSPSMEFATSRPGGLSTISGVFAPVALSMFSILLFMRMGFVVGQLGFLVTIVQLAMAYAIVMLTVLSLCAISSNGAVEGGGVYYMISRSLGPEFGGAIGVLFFVANVFSCALYISGFTEALMNNIGNGQFPDSPTWRFIYCVMVSLVLLVVSLLGSALFAKTALITFILISVCYSTWIFSVIFNGHMAVAIPKVNTPAYRVPVNATDPSQGTVEDFNQTLTANYTGLSFHTLGENMFPDYTMDYTTEKPTDFALMFAIIFSGVTGLMAGANMSGELARPSVSIPRGTVQAVLTTLFVYVMTAFFMASTSSRYLLQNDYTVMMDTNLNRIFILIGIFSTTLFSSMSNLIGSSRVLNRLSHDKLFGCLLRPAKIEIGDRNPVVSVVITWICVVLVFLVGAMNKIAKLTSIFFLLSYMGVNVATLALELTSAPNFRPTFKYFSWQTCALGVIATGTMMLVVDASMSALGVVVLMTLIMVLHYQAPSVSSGSISQALIYHQVRKYLLLLDVRKEHVKYWRPQILLLVSRPASACSLLDFVNDLKKSGLYVVGHVRKGDMDSSQVVDPLQQVFPYWLSLVDYLKLKAFVELTMSNNIRHGIQQLMRLSGLGAMKPNTVVIGFHELAPSSATLQESQLLKDLRFSKIDRAAVVEYFTAGDYMPKELDGNLERLSPVDYVNVLKDVLHMTKNLCVARHFSKLDKEALSRGWNGQKRYIDVWPVDLQKPQETGLGWDNSSLFLLQLSCILSMSSRWRSYTKLRVFICVNSLQDMHRRERQLKNMLQTLRIEGESSVVPWDHVVCHYQPASPIANANSNAATPSVDLPPAYISAFNDMVKRYSEEAAITLLNLPVPPEDAEGDADKYLEMVRNLTDALPPTLLVHGVSSVISTAL